MNEKTRQRAMRGFLAALLQSDISVNEMLELAQELEHGGFARELGEYVREIAISTSSAVRPRGRGGDRDMLGESIYQTLFQRRLSKKAVHELMMAASPKVPVQDMSTSGTLRELVDRFLVVAPASDVTKFVRLLEGESLDPYLKGISRRD